MNKNIDEELINKLEVVLKDNREEAEKLSWDWIKLGKINYKTYLSWLQKYRNLVKDENKYD